MSSNEHPDVAAIRLKCDAPRVSQADLEANIAHEEFLVKVTHGGQVLRWCIITTKSGFAVVGEPAASVSPENDRQELGERYSRENTIRKLWPLMAYELKNKLAAAPPKAVTKNVLTYADLKTLNSQELYKFGYRYEAESTDYVHLDGTRVQS